MAKTSIEWCDWTINCFWGCRNGCSYCAARSIARRFGRSIGTKRGYSPEVIGKMANFEPVFLGDQLLKIVTLKKPTRIFMSFMGEPFCKEFEPHMQMTLDYIKQFPQHTIMMLTKQPQNLAKWSPFPDNCFIGVSATNAKMAEEAGFWLWEIKAKVKFISFEPLLESIPVHFSDYLSDDVQGISWVILGQQTPIRKATMPRISWIQEIVEAADKAGVRVFLKDNLDKLLHHRWQDNVWGKLFRNEEESLRQEFPLTK